jgi:acetamidase/formamidase
MKMLWSAVLCVSLLVNVSALGATSNVDYTGRWEVNTSYPGGSYVSGLDLATDADRYQGRSGYLIPDNVFPYKYAGALQKDGLHLQILTPDGTTVIGDILLTATSNSLSGKGLIHDIPITLSGRRPLKRPTNAPTVHTFEPQIYYRTFSGANPPALDIFPGDAVRTKTVDAAGFDEKGVRRALPGNPQTGPFYIEGAMVGDMIAVHFNRIRLNRDTAFQFRAAIGVLPPGYEQEHIANWSSIWKLDRAHGTATPDQPSDKLKNLTVKLIPMLGCVGVAPYWNQAYETSQLGVYGGNLDYNQIREGTTLYMPVFQAGALLTIGDGHALQADGEITGQGLETSMDVEFTVDLIRNIDLVRSELLSHPWAENDEYIMVSGIGGSLTDAIQLATRGLSEWLKIYYRLNSAEIATVLASSVHYDVAEVVDPQLHVVAKIQKEILSQLPKPESAPAVRCMAQRGCATN